MSSTSSSSAAGPFNFTNLITIKLTPDNYLLLRAQMIPILKSHLLMGYIDGTFPPPDKMIPNPRASEKDASPTLPNPAHTAWVQQDQAILSAILSSLTEGVLGMVLLATTASEAWSTLSSSFSSQSTAKSMQIRSQLAATKKNGDSIAVYFNKVKILSDTLTTIGQTLRPEEFISYLLAGLDSDYDPLVEVVSSRTDPMPVRDLYSHMLNTEQRIENRKAEFNSNIHSANTVSYGNKTGGGGNNRPPSSRSDSRQGGKPSGAAKPPPANYGGGNNFNN